MATKTIKRVITKPAVVSPTMSTDPTAIYQQLAQMPQGGATPFDQTYNDAANRYRAAANSTYVLPDVLKSYLGGVSPQYTQDKAAVLNQFADKASPLYISNPFARLQAAQAANQGQQQTYSQVLDRVNRLVGMGVSQQQQNVSDLGAQVTGAQAAQKDQRAALQQQFNNALNLAQEHRANKSAADSGNGTKDRLLTFTEAKTLGVPIGTKLSAVFGQKVPTTNIVNKPLNKFITDYQQRNQISVDPSSAKGAGLYNDYVDAQDAIRSAANPLEKYNDLIKQFPDLVGVVEAPKTLSSAELLNQYILSSTQGQ